MAAKRRVEVFSAGCPICQEAIEVIRREACPSCEIIVQNMMETQVAERARKLGIRSVPAVVINDILVPSSGGGIDIQVLKDAGLGRAL